MIGIIGAMEQEVNAIKEHMKIDKEVKYLDLVFYLGTIDNQSVVLLLGGIGKVNASLCTTILLDKYNIDYLINIGSGGGLHLDQEVGNIVIASGTSHHDVDLTGFNYEYGQLPQLPLVFDCDQKLVDLASKIMKNNNINYKIGLIVSGDQFINSETQVKHIINHFPDAICSEMEAASISQVAFKFNVPFIIIRSVSDVVGKGENEVQFDEFINLASKQSAKICVDLIKSGAKND